MARHRDRSRRYRCFQGVMHRVAFSQTAQEEPQERISSRCRIDGFDLECFDVIVLTFMSRNHAMFA